MNKELRLSIAEAWNEAEELDYSLSTLSDAEIIQCKDALKNRAKKIMNVLNKYVAEDDVEKVNI